MFENEDANLFDRAGAERFRFFPLGDRAIVIECSESGGTADWSAMALLANHVEANRERWMIDIVPAYKSVTVVYDPALLWREESETDAVGWNMLQTGNVPYERAKQRLLEVTNREWSGRLVTGRVVKIPVCYGGEGGPDLAEAAAYAGLTEVELCRRHSEAEYHVAMIGFMPGFPYLIGLPDSIAQPRKAVPRLRVEAGSVGIAGGQTGVYPLTSPGGWQLIGRTPLKLFDAERSEPSFLRAGDTVRFVPIAEEAFGDELVDVDTNEESGSRQLLAIVAGTSEGEAGFLVRRPGLHTTIQDLGRAGYRSIGLPAGGAMDSYALRVANLLVGNGEAAAALELALVGPELEAQNDMLIAVCGAYMAPTIDGEELPMWRPVWVRSGAVLRFASAINGCRAYIAVAGGIGVPEVLGSRSTYARAALGGLGGRRLAAGDVVPCGSAGAAAASRWAAAWMAALAALAGGWAAAPWFAQPLAYGGGSSDDDGIELRAMPGSEFGQFSEAARTALYRERYRVAPDSDRMGCRLDGSPLTRTTHAELLSHGVTAGAVQVPSGGGPIVLAADCQTTGGYPKIAHVASVDLPLLAQAKPGDTIRFRQVSLEEAQRLELARERELRQLALAIRCRLP